MIFKKNQIDQLGEKTLNKIATVAIASQIQAAKKLSVEIKTDPNLLAKGMLESLAIDGQDLVMAADLRLRGMKITLNKIAVSPFKALMGNIQLTQPSEGDAKVHLNREDLEAALCTRFLSQQLPPHLEITSLLCKILDNGKMVIQIYVCDRQSDEVEEILLVFSPALCPIRQGITLDEPQIVANQAIDPVLKTAIIDRLAAILNLQNLKMQGISLNVHDFKFANEEIQLEAKAQMTHFPKKPA